MTSTTQTAYLFVVKANSAAATQAVRWTLRFRREGIPSTPVVLEFGNAQELKDWLEDSANGIANIGEVFFYVMGFTGDDAAILINIISDLDEKVGGCKFRVDALLTDETTKEDLSALIDALRNPDHVVTVCTSDAAFERFLTPEADV